jgi:dTDP-4-dehydrorhamnose reductase
MGIWITGAGGLIGSYLARANAERAIPLRREDLELTDFAAVRARFRRERPAAVIHCAALSRTPACQADPALAHKLNVQVTKVLADLSSDIPFVFFSTDMVFDGRAGNYDEMAPVNPLSVYGKTKAEAEQAVLANPKHTVIRTSLNVGTSPTGDRSFNEQLRLAWESGRTLTLFTDEFRRPIPAEATARAVWELIAARQPGLYHVAGAERLSRYQAGQLIADRYPQLHPKLAPDSLKDYRGEPRPPDVSLNCAKAQQLLSFPLPSLRDWIASNQKL